MTSPEAASSYRVSLIPDTTCAQPAGQAARAAIVCSHAMLSDRGPAHRGGRARTVGVVDEDQVVLLVGVQVELHDVACAAVDGRVALILALRARHALLSAIWMPHR